VLGQILRVGDSPAWLLAGVHLDQLSLVEQLHQGRVRPNIEMLSQVTLWCRVQRLTDLDVEIAVHLHPSEDRHVIRVGHSKQCPCLTLGEYLGRPGLGGAMDAPAGGLAAPLLRPGLGIS
jgi:hypothetical protein